MCILIQTPQIELKELLTEGHSSNTLTQVSINNFTAWNCIIKETKLCLFLAQADQINVTGHKSNYTLPWTLLRLFNLPSSCLLGKRVLGTPTLGTPTLGKPVFQGWRIESWPWRPGELDLLLGVGSLLLLEQECHFIVAAGVVVSCLLCATFRVKLQDASYFWMKPGIKLHSSRWGKSCTKSFSFAELLYSIRLAIPWFCIFDVIHWLWFALRLRQMWFTSNSSLQKTKQSQHACRCLFMYHYRQPKFQIYFQPQPVSSTFNWTPLAIHSFAAL